MFANISSLLQLEHGSRNYKLYLLVAVFLQCLLGWHLQWFLFFYKDRNRSLRDLQLVHVLSGQGLSALCFSISILHLSLSILVIELLLWHSLVWNGKILYHSKEWFDFTHALWWFYIFNRIDLFWIWFNSLSTEDMTIELEFWLRENTLCCI